MPTDARQGMGGAKNAYRGSQEVRRADTPNQGFQVARNRASLLQSRLARNRKLLGWEEVVDRRCCSDGGLGYSQTVSGCAQGAAGTVAASVVKGERVSKRFSRQRHD